MTLRVYNTLTKQKELFEPVRPGKVGMYLCGPTVYKAPHIGHMVGPVIFDAVKRYLWRQEGKPSIVAGRRGIEALCRGNFLMCPTACYRKSRLGVRRFSDRWQFVLDLELFARLLFDGGYFVLIPDRIYAYRRHAENTTEQHTQSLRRFEEEFSIYNHLAEVARKRVWLLAAHRADTRLLLRLNLVFRIGVVRISVDGEACSRSCGACALDGGTHGGGNVGEPPKIGP